MYKVMPASLLIFYLNNIYRTRLFSTTGGPSAKQGAANVRMRGPREALHEPRSPRRGIVARPRALYQRPPEPLPSSEVRAPGARVSLVPYEQERQVIIHDRSYSVRSKI